METTKSNIRKALNKITQISNEVNEGMRMDLMMDGSGECGGIIADSWHNWYKERVNSICNEIGVTLDTLIKTTTSWANVELEKTSPKIWVSMYSKKNGQWMERSFFDTRWGMFSCELSNLSQI